MKKVGKNFFKIRILSARSRLESSLSRKRYNTFPVVGARGLRSLMIKWDGGGEGDGWRSIQITVS